MVQYFYGPDTYGAREAIGQLAKEKNLPIRWVDREDLETTSLGTILDQAGSGLFGGQLVVIRDSSSFPKELQEQIVEAAQEQKSAEWIVWDREQPDKRSKLFAALKKYGRTFPELSEQELVRWGLGIEKIHIQPDAARELVRRAGPDRWRIKSEVEKLALTNTSITVEAVRTHVPAPEAADDIFPFLDALAAGNARRALTLLQEQLLAGNSELYILSMLGYQYKTLLAIVAGKTDGLHPYVIQKNMPAARRYSIASLQNVLARLAATDFAIKQGKVDQRTALTMLVLALTQPQPNRA